MYIATFKQEDKIIGKLSTLRQACMLLEIFSKTYYCTLRLTWCKSEIHRENGFCVYEAVDVGGFFWGFFWLFLFVCFYY